MSSAIGDARSVDLNAASEQDLEKVGGLGRERAERIVQSRPFQNWDDVKAIEGFNDKLVQDLKSSGATLGNGR
jgi:DNA uptake protein ComE-like DNA-binding protein